MTPASDAPSLPRIAGAKKSVERLVIELTYRERGRCRDLRDGIGQWYQGSILGK
ncbi:MAG: hypothetical protein ACYDEA_00395 [Candidatus Dormibacteria bacterium]